MSGHGLVGPVFGECAAAGEGPDGAHSPDAATSRPCSGDPLFGPVCPCGQPKSKQARKCQTCRTIEKRKPLDEQYLDGRYGGVRVIGSGRYTAARLRDELVQAAAAATGELAELVTEQARDSRFGDRAGGRWVVSLDDVDRYGRPLHEVIAA